MITSLMCGNMTPLPVVFKYAFAEDATRERREIQSTNGAPGRRPMTAGNDAVLVAIGSKSSNLALEPTADPAWRLQGKAATHRSRVRRHTKELRS